MLRLIQQVLELKRQGIIQEDFAVYLLRGLISGYEDQENLVVVYVEHYLKYGERA